MTDNNEKDQKRQIDVNSGAAPQPGGWAGLEGAEVGHALPGPDSEVEQKRGLDEPQEVSGGSWLQDRTDSQPQGEKDSKDSQESAPAAQNDEQEAVDQHSLETQAIYPPEEGKEDQQGVEESEAKPAKKAAKKAPAKKK